MGPTGCPETSVRNYHYTLCNIPEERRSQCWLCTARHKRLYGAWFQIEFQKVTGKQLILDLTKATMKVKLSVALNVSVLTTLLFVMQRGFTWWQGLCFAYCICLSVITTGAWCTMGKGLQLIAQSIMTELQLVRQSAIKPQILRFYEN